jgi:regulation of enolase protein 1 (concanavalin A-like superfamily)
MTHAIDVPGIPFTLFPSAGSIWQSDAVTNSIRVTADPHSDIFVDPGGGDQVSGETLMNAVTLLADAPEGDFQLSARVTVDFASTFDAGVLLLWMDEKHWAKFCFEYSPDKEPMVVSVVNRDVADDANSIVIDRDHVWLRVSRIGRVYAYHASLDATRWRLIRAFALESSGTTPRIGFEAQSPTGEGCDVVFSEISFIATTLLDLRDGS